MKMTMHIDETLLERVMEATGASSKTQAVNLALREIDNRAKLVKLAQAGLGLTASELKDAFDPASDIDAKLRNPKNVSYARKSRSH